MNNAAEHFFDMGRALLQRSRLDDIMPFGSPVLDLVEEAIAANAPISGYKLDVSTPRTGLGQGWSTLSPRRCPTATAASS